MQEISNVRSHLNSLPDIQNSGIMNRLNKEGTKWPRNAVSYMIVNASNVASAIFAIWIQQNVAIMRKVHWTEFGKDSPEYRAIRVDGIIDETMDPKEYLYDDEETLGSNDDDIMDDDDLFPFMRGNR